MLIIFTSLVPYSATLLHPPHYFVVGKIHFPGKMCSLNVFYASGDNNICEQTATTLCQLMISGYIRFWWQRVSQRQVFGVHMHQTISSLRAPAGKISSKLNHSEGARQSAFVFWLLSRRLGAATQERNPTLTYPRLLHFVGFRFTN